MDDVTIVRALHVVSVVLWIGGVAFVTTVLLPTVRRLKARQEQMQLFDQIEQRFLGRRGIDSDCGANWVLHDLSLRYVGSLPACRLLVD